MGPLATCHPTLVGGANDHVSLDWLSASLGLLNSSAKMQLNDMAGAIEVLYEAVSEGVGSLSGRLASLESIHKATSGDLMALTRGFVGMLREQSDSLTSRSRLCSCPA
jgi:hypothetical protein